MYRILIVEDDLEIAEGLKEQLGTWGMEARASKDFQNIIGEFQSASPDLVLMDIGLPYYNGYYWCQEIRKISKVPILFLSSASDNMNIVMAINMGGDDFVAKPFDMSVLVAKIQAVLRRTYEFGQAAVSVLEHRGAVLNLGDHTLSYRGETIALTKNEYGILKILMEHKGQIVSREQLFKQLWETDTFIDDNTLTVNVNRLRRKLEQAGLEEFIMTKFGVGYLVE